MSAWRPNHRIKLALPSGMSSYETLGQTYFISKQKICVKLLLM